jgi:hypothetical protein
VARVLAEFGEGALAVEVYLVDFDSLEVVGHAA